MLTPHALPSAHQKAQSLSWPACNLHPSRLPVSRLRTLPKQSTRAAGCFTACRICLHTSEPNQTGGTKAAPASARAYPNRTKGSHQTGLQHTRCMKGQASLDQVAQSHAPCAEQRLLPSARSAGMRVLGIKAARLPHSSASCAFIEPFPYAALVALDIIPCTLTYYLRTKKQCLLHQLGCSAAQLLDNGSRHRQSSLAELA